MPRSSWPAVQTALTIVVVVLLGLPYALPHRRVSALAMLIPFFGPPLALVPPIIATAIFDPGWLLVVAPLLLIVQTVLVNYLQPRLMREALGMHPVLVLVGLLVGCPGRGRLWGALFGIPILAVLNVFFNYAINLRTIDETPSVEIDEVIEEVRRDEPEADPRGAGGPGRRPRRGGDRGRAGRRGRRPRLAPRVRRAAPRSTSRPSSGGRLPRAELVRHHPVQATGTLDQRVELH